MRELFMFFCLLAFVACNGKSQQEPQNDKDAVPVFEMISVPNVITDPQNRADYIIEHYWEKFDFTDTTYIHYPAVTEQAFSNYIMFLSHASPEKVASSIQNMLSKAEADSTMFAYFTNLYERYLYDPNAPMRNEDFYIAVLEKIMASPNISEIDKIRPAHILEMALKNRVGEKANDFTYTLKNGKRGSIYNINTDYLVIYFLNPDCESCRHTTKQLTDSPVINDLINRKKLIVLSVYPDENLIEWENHLDLMPKKWINSYDHAIALRNEEIYDLRAIPSLYLLDKDKKVILKDTSFEQLEKFLYNNSSL